MTTIVLTQAPATNDATLKIGDVSIQLHKTNLKTEDVESALNTANITSDEDVDLTKLLSFFKELFSKQISQDQATKLIQGILAVDGLEAKHLIEILGDSLNKPEFKKALDEVLKTQQGQILFFVELSKIDGNREAAIRSLKRIYYPRSDSENAKNGCYFIEQLLKSRAISEDEKKELLTNVATTKIIAKKLSLQNPEELDGAYIEKLTNYFKFSSNDSSSETAFNFANTSHQDMILRAPSDLKDMLDKVQSIEEFRNTLDIDENKKKLLTKLFIDKKGGKKDTDVAWIPSGYIIERFLNTYNNDTNRASLKAILDSWEGNPDKENRKTEKFYKALIKADFLVRLENSQKPGSTYRPSFLGSWGYSHSWFDSGSWNKDTKTNNRNFLQNVIELDKLIFLGEGGDRTTNSHPFIKIVDEYSRCSSEASKALYRKAVYQTLSDLKVLKSDTTLEKEKLGRNIKSAKIDATKSLPCSKDDFYHLVHLNIANKRKETSRNDLARILENTDDTYKTDKIQEYVEEHMPEMIDREKNNKDILCVKEPKQPISYFAGGVGGAIRYVVNATVSPFRKVANGASYYSDLPGKTIRKAYASCFVAREADSAIFKE